MKKYECSICNEKHAVFYSTESPMPDLLENKHANEVIERLSENAFIVNNEQLIISGDIIIETEVENLEMQHRIWVKICAKAFFSNFEALKANNEINLDCELLSELPFYQKSKGLKANFKMQSSTYGTIQIKSESKLKDDQVNSISKIRVIELMENLYHYGEKEKNFEKSFAERLNVILEIAKKEYQANGKMFVIDLISANKVLFQLVSSEMINNTKTGGFVLHVSNDESNADFEIVKSSMNKLNEKIKLDLIQLDEIDTYQKYYNCNSKELKYDIEKIISEVYEEKINEIKIEIFEP